VKKSKYKIAIFISGKGSNAKKLVEYFREHNDIEVAIIVSNKPNIDIENLCLSNGVDYIETSEVIDIIKNRNVDLIVLAGYLKLIPDELISKFPNRIINIHPSLLPKFGGKGMYGKKVHQSVIDSGEKENIKNNFKSYLMRYNWSDSVQINISEEQFWLYFKVKLK
jgi:phosphoribosylglycinamide formyltransferase-1